MHLACTVSATYDTHPALTSSSRAPYSTPRPQLKSVAHLPWRQMTYKFLNTIIDDLFAFVIKMPTMHRLAVFRDDLIFPILLYQRWIYPVDKTRVNGGSFSRAAKQARSCRDFACHDGSPRSLRHSPCLLCLSCPALPCHGPYTTSPTLPGQGCAYPALLHLPTPSRAPLSEFGYSEVAPEGGAEGTQRHADGAGWSQGRPQRATVPVEDVDETSSDDDSDDDSDGVSGDEDGEEGAEREGSGGEAKKQK